MQTTVKPALSVRNAADRQRMAALVAALAIGCEATVRRREAGPQCIYVDIQAPGELKVSVVLNGKSSAPDLHILHWHISKGCTNILAAKFGGVSTVNNARATHVGYGFEWLCLRLKRSLELARTRQAFEFNHLVSVWSAS